MRRPWIATALLVAACSSIGAPLITSDQVYEFRDTDVATPLVFNWPHADLPVRIWVAADGPLRQHVQDGIDRWEHAFLYGEFQATIVTDSTTADVIVRNDPPDIGTGVSGRAPQCTGVTTGLDPDTRTMVLPMHVFIYAVVSDNDPSLDHCYSITATHELGHVIGIINSEHSGTTSADVMFANPMVDLLSDHDRLTAATLYLVHPNVTITGRR